MLAKIFLVLDLVAIGIFFLAIIVFKGIPLYRARWEYTRMMAEQREINANLPKEEKQEKEV